jgi:hypothetical protein
MTRLGIESNFQREIHVNPTSNHPLGASLAMGRIEQGAIYITLIFEDTFTTY